MSGSFSRPTLLLVVAIFHWACAVSTILLLPV